MSGTTTTPISMENTVNGPAVKHPTPKAKGAKGKGPKAKGKAKGKARATATTGPRDGSVVGYGAKSAEDCKWTDLKVEFYKALKKLPHGGTSKEIAEKSGGKINAGHARHFGYHGVGGGLVKIEKAIDGNTAEREGVRGFLFVLTAKGKGIDPAKELAKQQGK